MPRRCFARTAAHRGRRDQQRDARIPTAAGRASCTSWASAWTTDDAAFEAALERQRIRAHGAASRRSSIRLRELGMPVDDALADGRRRRRPASSVGRPHVARAMVAAGHATSVDDAFARVLARGRPGYVPRQGLGPREAIDAIRSAGGLAVLAHFREAIERPVAHRAARCTGVWAASRSTTALSALHAAARSRRWPSSPRRAASWPPAAATTTATTMPYAEATDALRVPDAVEEAVLAAIEAARAGR